MKELLEISLLPYMLPVTVGLVLFVLYVVLSVFTGALADAIEIDFDVDSDLESGGGSALDAFLSIVNADRVPTMIVLACLNWLMWMVAVALTMWFNPEHSNWIGLGILAVSFVIGVIGTRFVTMPLIPLFKLLKQGEDNGAKIENSHGVVKSIELTDKFGQVEISSVDGPVLVNARLRSAGTPLKRGEKVVVLEPTEKRNVYYVAKLKL